MKLLFIILTCLLPACVSHESNTSKIDKKSFIGLWVSNDDTSYRVSFTTRLKTEYYEKETTSTSTYKIVEDTLVTEDKDSKEIYKYSILKITDSTLSLIYLDRGNTLNFKKIGSVNR